MPKVSLVETTTCRVGEGAHWDEREQALFYLDIIGRKVHRYDPEAGTTRSWPTPANVGAMAFREAGGLVLGMNDCFALLDLESGQVERIVECGRAATGPINDGKADAAGRFIVGQCGPGLEDPLPSGGIFALAPDGELNRLASGIHISNSVCFSADGRTLYYADSHTSCVCALDYDPDTGAASNKHLFTDTSSLGGVPDGATPDADGLIWMAVFGSGQVVAFRPDGSVERSIELPVKLVSSVAFGGPDLDRLYVTTLDGPELGEPAEENGGAVFMIEDLGTRGLPEMRFRG